MKRTSEKTAPLSQKICEVLLVEDNEDHAELIVQLMRRQGAEGFTLKHVSTLAAAREVLGASEKETHVVLLDLSLPDSELTDTLDTLSTEHPNLPIVVLTSLNDIEFASESVQRGAQDFLVKSELTGDLLVRSLTYAIERKRYAVALEESNAELRRFASTVAHEIRSPMSVIHSCLEIVSRRHKEDFSESTATIVGNTLERVVTVSELIDDLLRFARVEPGTNFKRFDVGRCVKEAIDMCQRDVRKARAEIEVAEMPSIVGDAALIRQVFQNLLLNALKYSQRSPMVRIESRSTEGTHIFSVSDNGVGIAPENIKDVFKIFKTVSGPNAKSGSGIGLSLSKRIVEHHKGSIWIESEFGKGSTVYIEIPHDPLAEPNSTC